LLVNEKNRGRTGRAAKKGSKNRKKRRIEKKAPPVKGGRCAILGEKEKSPGSTDRNLGCQRDRGVGPGGKLPQKKGSGRCFAGRRDKEKEGKKKKGGPGQPKKKKEFRVLDEGSNVSKKNKKSHLGWIRGGKKKTTH